MRTTSISPPPVTRKKQDVGADGQFTITGPNVIRVASLPEPVRQSFAGLADVQNIALGLCDAPIVDGVVPDCAEIALCRGGETRAVHSGRDRRLSFRKVSKSKGDDGPLFSPSIRATRRASSFISCSSSRRRPARTTSLAEP